MNSIDTVANYLKFLRENPTEIEALMKNFLIQVTSLFRDKEGFESLKQKICQLVKDKPEGSQLTGLGSRLFNGRRNLFNSYHYHGMHTGIRPPLSSRRYSEQIWMRKRLRIATGRDLFRPPLLKMSTRSVLMSSSVKAIILIKLRKMSEKMSFSGA